MEITLITVGKTTIPYVREGIEDYLKRLKHYIGFNIITIADIKDGGRMSEQARKDAEGDKILASVSASDHVALLDERGFETTSEGFASILQKQMSSGLKRLVFVIGGPYGFSSRVYERADSRMSLSRLTLNHEMVRMFFVEQVYRAMTILHGEPYHHR